MTLSKEKFLKILKKIKPEKFFKLPPRELIFRSIIFPSLLGFIAGAAASLICVSLFLKCPFSMDEKIITLSQAPSRGLNEQKGADGRFFKDFSAKVVGVYKKEKDSGNNQPAGGQPVTAEILDKSEIDFLASGLPVTSDGWIVTVYDKEKISSEWGVVWNRVFYPSEKILKDSFTNLVFLKIKTDGLPLVAFGQTEEIQEGDELFSFDAQKTLSFTRVLNTRWNRDSLGERSSEVLDVYLKTEELTLGAPIFNLHGELMGIAKDSQGGVFPSQYVKEALKTILKDGKIRRPVLGVFYLDLSAAFSTTKPLMGALIQGPKESKAVAKNSPAAKAGLKEGDIILSVDNFELNQNQTLAEVLAGFSPGTKVVLTILRDGQEKKVEVILGEQK